MHPAKAQTCLRIRTVWLSDQSLCLSLEFSLTVKLLTEHHLEFLSLKGDCKGSSDSTFVKIPHCCKSHVEAHYKSCLINCQDRWGTYITDVIVNLHYFDFNQFETSFFMSGSRGGRGELPLKNHNNIVFFILLVRISWKITKPPSQHLMFGHHRPASETPFSETPFKWRFAGGPIMAHL